MGLGLMATALDPPVWRPAMENVIKVESLSGINLVLLFFGLAMVVLGGNHQNRGNCTLKKNFSGRLGSGMTYAGHERHLPMVRHPAYLGAIIILALPSNGLQCSRIPSDVPACALLSHRNQTRGEDAHRCISGQSTRST